MNLTQIRVFATKIVERFPKELREIVFKTIIEMRFLSFRIEMAYSTHRMTPGSVPSPSEVYWISPNRIIYHTNYLRNEDAETIAFYDRVFPRQMRGRIVGGNWDRTSRKFTDLTVYKAFRERIMKGAKWQDTEFYGSVLGNVKSGRFVWGIKNKADLDNRCKYLDSLYENIKNEGYRLNRSVRDRNIDYDEIEVNIGRNGEYLFQNGVHRLSIAKILGINYVPVMVFVRHKKWQDFRAFVISYAQKQRRHKLFQPIVHADLADVPYFDDNDSEGLMKAIKSHLGKSRGTMLDIGANLGFFCHKFEDLGYKCYAVEQDPATFQILEKIRIAENRKFKTINASIFEASFIKNTKFDVVLALSIFHHFLKTEKHFSLFKDLLKNLETDVLFFEPHRPQEDQMKDAFVNYGETEFVDFLLQHTSLKKSEAIYTAKNKRTLFKLSK